MRFVDQEGKEIVVGSTVVAGVLEGRTARLRTGEVVRLNEAKRNVRIKWQKSWNRSYMWTDESTLTRGDVVQVDLDEVWCVDNVRVI